MPSWHARQGAPIHVATWRRRRCQAKSGMRQKAQPPATATRSLRSMASRCATPLVIAGTYSRTAGGGRACPPEVGGRDQGNTGSAWPAPRNPVGSSCTSIGAALDARLEGEIKLRQRLDGRQARGAHRGLQATVVAARSGRPAPARSLRPPSPPRCRPWPAVDRFQRAGHLQVRQHRPSRSRPVTRRLPSSGRCRDPSTGAPPTVLGTRRRVGSVARLVPKRW